MVIRWSPKKIQERNRKECLLILQRAVAAFLKNARHNSEAAIRMSAPVSVLISFLPERERLGWQLKYALACDGKDGLKVTMCGKKYWVEFTAPAQSAEDPLFGSEAGAEDVAEDMAQEAESGEATEV